MFDSNCLACGKRISSDAQYCPYCKVEVGSKKVDDEKARSGRFIWIVVVLAVLCVAIALWLPRDVTP